MKKLNVVFGKIGKSMLFNKEKWGIIGGDHEAPALLAVLAQMNPNINFHIIGRSDYSKLDPIIKNKLNINNNIFDAWEMYKKGTCPPEDWIIKYTTENSITIDFGLIISGLCGSVNIPNSCYTMDGTRVASVIYMLQNYTAPIMKYLNHSNISYVEVGEDPRYFPMQGRDLMNRPKYILATKDIPEGFTVKMIQGYLSKEPLIEKQIPIRNGNIVNMFMASEPDRRLKTPNNRSNLISVYSNGLRDSGGINKFPHIKDYILDNFNDAIIYGDWPVDTPGIADYIDRFKKIPMMQLQQQMYDTKYAFMIPIQVGWPTCKYFKHLIFGMIPFLHPFADPDRYLPAPDFTRVESAKQMKERIDYLESNPSAYTDLWYETQSLLKDEYFDGFYFNNIILDVIKEHVDTSGIDLTPIAKKYNMSCLFKDDDFIKTQKTLF